MQFHLVFAILVVLLTTSNHTAVAQGLFPAGAELKAAGMESSQLSRGAPATLYNPANLSLSAAHELYLELGYISAEQSYEHPDFDQVKVRVRTILGSAGYSGTLGVPNLNFGFMLFPERRGGQKIPGLPRKVLDNYQALEAETKDDVTNLGLGLSYAFPFGLSIGHSWIYSQEVHEITANEIDDSNPLIKFKGKNSFYRPLWGARYQFRWLSVSQTYKPAKAKSYKGEQKSTSQEEPSDPRVIHYAPEVWAFGIGGSFPDVEAHMSLNHQKWKKADGVIREGLTSDTRNADVKSIWEWGLFGAYKFLDQYHVSLAYAILPSPWGPGKRAASNGEEDVMGVDLGQYNNVKRRVLTVGGGYQTQSVKLVASLMLATGAREIDRNGANPGYYQQETAILSTGVRMAF